MSTMTFDAAGIAGVREVSPVKQALGRRRTPQRNNLLPEAPAASASVRRTKTWFSLGSAVAYECDSWARWTGV